MAKALDRWQRPGTYVRLDARSFCKGLLCLQVAVQMTAVQLADRLHHQLLATGASVTSRQGIACSVSKRGLFERLRAC
jgi:hypothetical protein